MGSQLALAAIVVIGGVACDSSKKTSAGAATVEPGASKAKPAASAAKPQQPAKTAAPAPTVRPHFSGAHVLVGFKGAKGSKAKVTRTKEQALALAKTVAAEARKKPEAFAALAKQHSDGPSGPFGGNLGTWQQGRMIPTFQKAIEQLPVGGISEPTESAFGYHVIKRLAVPPEEELAATQLVVGFKGAQHVKPSVTRTKERAGKLAAELVTKLRKAPDSFVALAKKHSDARSAAAGGTMPPWSTRSSRMPPVFTSAVVKLKIGEIADPIETPFGYYIFRRVAPPASFAGSHILVAYKGSQRAKPTITRSKAKAKAKAKKLAKQVQTDATKFTELAKANSDGPSASRGGSLGTWRQGMMAPAFDEAVEKLKVGEVTGAPVETPFGFHVIRRDPLPKKD